MSVLELTRELVAVNSVNPFRTIELDKQTFGIGNEAGVCGLIEQQLTARGFEVERQVVEEERVVELSEGRVHIPARWNVLAQRGSGARALLLYGHTDTVDVKEGWESDPFTLTQREVDGRTRLYGLGANDMKSGLAAIIAASEAPLPPDVQLKLAFVCDEEFWSFGAEALLRSSFVDNVGFALTTEILEAAVAEGEQWLGIGKFGREEFEFKLRGRGCHGADAFVDPEAVNAAEQAARFVDLLSRRCRESKQVFLRDGIEAVNSSFISLLEAGKGVLSVPDSARIVLDRSFLPDEDPEAELQALQELARAARSDGTVDRRAEITVGRRARPTPPCLPYFLEPAEPCVRFVRSAAAQFARSVKLGIGRGVADENRLAARGIPTLILSPDGAGSHSSAEWVDAASIVRLKDILGAVCSSAELADILAAPTAAG